jgi:hypothetical protein
MPVKTAHEFFSSRWSVRQSGQPQQDWPHPVQMTSSSGGRQALVRPVISEVCKAIQTHQVLVKRISKAVSSAKIGSLLPHEQRGGDALWNASM